MRFIKVLCAISILLLTNSCAGAKPPRRNLARKQAPKEIIELMNDGKFEQAQERINQILNRPRVGHIDSIKVLPLLANCYCGMRQWEKAERIYRWLTENDDKNRLEWRTLTEIVSEKERDIQKEHLPKTVNSKLGEIMPVISQDGNTLYFIVDDGRNQDIYYSTLGNDGNWTARNPMGPPLNTNYSDGILSVMPDGNTVLLNGIYNSDGTKTVGYSLSHNLGDSWSFPEPVKIDNFYNKNKYTSACLASDGKTLLLALERDDGYGDLDIYICFRKQDGTFSEPKNLGPTINTKGTDGTPFLASDGVSLYFSSDGHPALGNSDMFVARRLDDSWTNWTIPKNLGKEFNTVGWDAYYTTTAEGDWIYFVSSGSGAIGGTDIFRARLPQEVQPKPVVTVTGTVSDTKGNAVKANIQYERLSDGKNLGIATSNPKTGNYSIVLPAGEKYGFSIHQKGYLFYSDHIDLTEIDTSSTIQKDIVIQPVEIGSQIVLKNIFFEFDKAELLPESIGELNRLLNLMKENPQIKVEIAGHTDSVGTQQYNKQLSLERAESVKDWLIDHGIDEWRIETKGFGESEPVADNSSEEGRAKNRRVTFTVTEIKK
ncbi:hypothetical protein DRQ33_07970 [bacterium]|nr:MAG: hypothetical protein DRQ33_07970 [bacterium]